MTETRHSHLSAVVVLLAVGALLPTPELSAQVTRTWGVTAGRVSARQIWSGADDTDYLTGILVGVFTDVHVPLPGLSVRAELLYTQRGTLVSDPQAEGLPEGRLRSHYMSVPLHLKAGYSIGPVSAYLFGGPTFEQLLSTSTDGGVGEVLREERQTVVNVSAGGGIGVQLPRDLVAGFELRVTEGLGDSYAGDFITMRNRSVEVLARLGTPF
jgi:hypothetical protein